jgi:hypothetical protein
MAEKNIKFRYAPPKASAMVEALRGLGYSLATALADVIDNSISAKAKLVNVQFIWNDSASRIIISDNGHGMTDKELDLAMRLGEKNPLDDRSHDDLGRFGLGLKTASFSQCRRLTVASKKNGNISCLRWDLDVLSSSTDDGWRLLEGPAEGSEHLIETLKNAESGTLVIWEILDRIVTNNFREQDFLDVIDKVDKHLSMVFHRYLSGQNQKIKISINDEYLKPWDPFFTAHSATWSSPISEIRTDSGLISVRGYVLPHKDRLTSAEYELMAGPDGWTAQQGFYIYRNERLLVSGSWLGLGKGKSWTKEEAHRLARIQIDIPNSADSDWKIDVRKSVARPPVQIRERLIRLAEDTRDRARRVFAHRGQIVRSNSGDKLLQAWYPENFSGGLRYKIDLQHPVIKGVLEESGALKKDIEVMLRVIEETIPIQRIWLDTSEQKETPRNAFGGQNQDSIMSVLMVVYKNLVIKKGFSVRLAKDQLHTMEPFNGFPTLIESLPDISENS